MVFAITQEESRSVILKSRYYQKIGGKLVSNVNLVRNTKIKISAKEIQGISVSNTKIKKLEKNRRKIGQ